MPGGPGHSSFLGGNFPFHVLQDSPPAAGRVSDIIPLRRSAFHAECFLMDRNDVLAIKIECALAHSRAEARLLQQPYTLAPSAHLRGAFLLDRNAVSIQ